MWQLCLNEATAAAHREAKRADTPADRNAIKQRAQRPFVKKMFPMVDDWFASWPESRRRHFIQPRAEYPLHQLPEAFKTALSLP